MRILDESMGIWRLWDVFWGCLYLWESLKKIKSHLEEVGEKKKERRKVKEKEKREQPLNPLKNQ